MARNGFPVPGGGNQLNAAAGRRTAVATGQVLNAPGGAPGIRGTPAGRLLSRAAGKNFIICCTGKRASSRTRNVTPCRCGQKNCLCRRAGIQTWRWRNGQPGSSGWLPCVLSRRKESWSWKGSLPRKVRSSLTCRHIPFLTCGINTAARSCSGDGGWVFCALSTGCWCHECSRSIATH